MLLYTVIVGGRNKVPAYRRDPDSAPKLVATLQTGDLPHGIWGSGGGRRLYVGLENSDAVQAVDTVTSRVVLCAKRSHDEWGHGEPEAARLGKGGVASRVKHRVITVCADKPLPNGRGSVRPSEPRPSGSGCAKINDATFSTAAGSDFRGARRRFDRLIGAVDNLQIAAASILAGNIA
jgi:hypothetical protein